MIELSDICFQYRHTPILNNLSIRMRRHGNTVLIGPSGCGKSTVLKLIAGLLAADSGSLRVDGEILTPSQVHRWRLRLGYVIQEGGLFPHMTVWENVTLMARQLKWPRADIDGRFAELSDMVQLAAVLHHRFPAQLSGGQRQRVSLMRALMLDPQVLLLDEPLGALDPMIRYELQQQLRSLFQQLNKTVIMVTHDLAEAAYFGGHIVLMKEGQVAQQGTLGALVKSPASAFVTDFIHAQQQPAHELNRYFA